MSVLPAYGIADDFIYSIDFNNYDLKIDLRLNIKLKACKLVKSIN